MRPLLTPAILALALALPGAPVAAQQWQRGDTSALLVRASTQRLTRDADTLLAAWRASAHGVVRMASIMDHGGTSQERVIRADQLEVEVYGEAPNRHKQFIIAWRDSSFLPNRIRYHRDHLGIVANDFGSTLRLGEGEEVRDVLHPLSPEGLTRYEFAVGDTLQIAGPKGTVRVVSVQVRPVDPNAAATVGTLYLDADRAVLVRFRFTFTAIAYRDPTVEDITVTLENALLEGVRWLPWRQSIVIRRGTPWLDLPIRTVLRADWTIDDYELGVTHPAERFLGFFVDGLRRPGGTFAWQGALADRLEILPHAEESIAAAQRDAASAVGKRLLAGLPSTRLLAGGLSDLVRINRVSGVTPGLGARMSLGAGVTARLYGGVGLSDGRVLGRVSVGGDVGGAAWTIGAGRELTDLGDAPSSSGFSASLRALLNGSDPGDWTLVERVHAGVRFPTSSGTTGIEVGREWSWSVPTDFTPLFGDRTRNIPLGSGGATVLRAVLDQRDAHGEGWLLHAEAGHASMGWRRVHWAGRTSVGVKAGRVVLAGEFGLGSEGLPGYRNFVLGGRGTLPGLPYRSLGGQRMGRVEVGWALPLAVPTPPIPNARALSLPSTLTPFLAVGVAGGDQPAYPWRASARLEPVAGGYLDLWGPLLRIEGGIGLRSGHLAFGFDIHPDWWPLF